MPFHWNKATTTPLEQCKAIYYELLSSHTHTHTHTHTHARTHAHTSVRKVCGMTTALEGINRGHDLILAGGRSDGALVLNHGAGWFTTAAPGGGQAATTPATTGAGMVLTTVSSPSGDQLFSAFASKL